MAETNILTNVLDQLPIPLLRHIRDEVFEPRIFTRIDILGLSRDLTSGDFIGLLEEVVSRFPDSNPQKADFISAFDSQKDNLKQKFDDILKVNINNIRPNIIRMTRVRNFVLGIKWPPEG